MDTESIISISSGYSNSGEEPNECPLGDHPNPSGREWTCSCRNGGKSNNHVLIEVEREEPQSPICLRYDFDKTATKNTTVSRKQEKSADKMPLLSYKRKGKSQMRKNVVTNDSPRAESPELLYDEPRHNGIQKNGITNRDIVMINAQLLHTPVSPESQKKELYNYLQLMNPADRNAARRVLTNTNRRSNRVKNLAEGEKHRQKEKRGQDEKDMEEEENDKQGEDRNRRGGSKQKSFENVNVTVNENKNLHLPLPPRECYQAIVDFEDTLSASGILNSRLQSLREVHKEKKKMFKPDRFKFNPYRKLKMLRSNGRLRSIDLDQIITNKSNLRQRARRKLLKAKEKLKKSKNQITKQLVIKVTPLDVNERRITTNSTVSPRQDDIKIQNRATGAESDDENVDLTNFVDDMLELDMLSEEHKKSLIESRRFTTQSTKIVNLISKKSLKEDKVKRAYKIFSDITVGNKSLRSADNLSTKTTEKRELNTNATGASHGSDHQYHRVNGSDDNTETNGLSERTETSTTIKHYVKTIEHAGNSKKAPPSPNRSSGQQPTQQDSAVTLAISAPEESISKVVCNPKTQRSQTPVQVPVPNGVSNISVSIDTEHNYAVPQHQHESSDSDDSGDDDDEESIPEEDQHSAASLSPVPMTKLDVIPVNKAVPVRSLHRSLTFRKRRVKQNHADANSNMWMNETPSEKKRRMDHSINISAEDGAVLGAFYEDHRLVVSQKTVVSFWTQSALGNILGAQDMWVPNGRIQRLVMNNKYCQKHSTDVVMANEVSVAYVELWTKEHKSDFRERPVCDVFAAVYFWRTGQKGLDKKVLQLENIKGFSDDVQYIVTKNAARIIVSWHYKTENEKKSHVHMYRLATDFQTVANISQIESVDHYISSLHNIEDSDSLLMACGENYITIWNIEYGYKVSTIRLSDIKLALSTHWVKCDRGFLFLVQECVDGELRLIAINGIDQTWKKLQNYTPPESFQSLKGVYVDNGFVLAFYMQGIICWDARTGKDVVEEVPKDIEYMPCGKYVIMIVNEQIVVRHALSHFITSDDF